MVCETTSKRAIFGTAFVLISAAIVVGSVIVYLQSNDNEEINKDETNLERVDRILKKVPLIDGHNAFPFNVRQLVYNNLEQVNFDSDLRQIEPWKSSNRSHTDLPRLIKGRVRVQFWVANTKCNSQYKDSVEQTLEQIDVIRRLVADYNEHLQWATSVSEIETAVKNGKIASLIGVEGGHSVQSSFGILRTLYAMGVRYMTLTNSCNTPWADSSPVDANLLEAQNKGLSPFGLKMVLEMNRLGMMVDISHASYTTMKAALINSKAPVIFSHSSVRFLCNLHRNIPDDILQIIKERDAVIMVNFYPNCYTDRNTTINDIVDQINYIKEKTSSSNIGLGADYDGVAAMPIGLEDVSKYPDLFLKLIESGSWSDDDLEKLAGENILRVIKKVEMVRDSMKDQPPQQGMITQEELTIRHVDLSCMTSKFP